MYNGTMIKCFSSNCAIEKTCGSILTFLLGHWTWANPNLSIAQFICKMSKVKGLKGGTVLKATKSAPGRGLSM